MKLLIISKNLLDQKDAQSQQSLAFIEALQEVFECIDVIAAQTTESDLRSLKHLETKNIKLYPLPAKWVSSGTEFIEKIKRKLLRNLMATLITKWAKAAGQLANALSRKNNYAAIITIGLPIESHMAGLQLTDKSKWIAHFSDPWPESLMPKPYSDYSIPIINWMQKNVVQKTINQAKLISFTCIQSRDLFAAHYKININKTYITPHVAPPPITPLKRSDKNFIITHAGSLSRERFFPEFFYAIKELPEESKVIVQFIGHVHPPAQQLVEVLKIQHRFVFKGQLNRNDTLLRLRESDALLLIEAKMEIYPFLPSKLADYSALGLPIYAITGKKSASAQILNSYYGNYTSTHSVASITKVLQEISTSRHNRNENSIYKIFDKRITQKTINHAIARIE